MAGHPERSEAQSRDPVEARAALPTGTGRFWIYIVTNDRRTVLYIGITNGLEKRLWQHGFDAGSEFTRKYHASRLIYYENYADPRDAIAREKQLKRWSRVKKETLIARINPEWRDLGAELFHDRAALPNVDRENTNSRSSRAERSGVEGPRDAACDSRSEENDPRSGDNPDLPRGPSTSRQRRSARDDRKGEVL